MKKLAKHPAQKSAETISSYAECGCMSTCFCSCYSPGLGAPYEYRTPENTSYNASYSSYYYRN